MCKTNVALQELHSLGLMLDKMTVRLSGNVVALHLDNIAAKAYQCNQGGTASFFSFLTSLQHFESVQQAEYYSYLSIHIHPSQCES